MNRRNFLKSAGLAALGAGVYGICTPCNAEDKAPDLKQPGKYDDDESRFIRPAMFYEKLDKKRIQCGLCPWRCIVGDGGRGRCGVRENRGGDYYTLVFGRAVALHNDPIEKKPFYHFLPGSLVLSLATAGCNIACKFCQNWQISQFKPEEVEARFFSPEDLVEAAVENKIPSIALTYSEPTVFFEYMHEIALRAREKGVNCVVVSNGFISKEAVKKLAPHLSAYKVDLKGFTEDYYKNFCSASLKPVLNTLETLAKEDLWLEIVNLVLPTANDSEEDISRMAKWIKTNLGDDVPIHFTRFHPMYKIRNLPPTPINTLKRCHDAARAEGLKYVYVGNAPGLPEGDTWCHNCRSKIIERTGLWAVESSITNGRCPNCGTPIPGVWS